MANRRPQQRQQQEENQIIKEEDHWVYESLEQFLSSPVYKGPLYSFFEENCMIFEDTKNITDDHKQVHACYREVINNMLYILSQDIQVEHQKIQQMAEIGLNIEGRTKIFWSIAIYYHFNEFVRFMVKKNIDLERKALQQMQGGEQQQQMQQMNPRDPNYQQQLQLQQQYEKKQQDKYDKEYEKAIKDSLALEELRKQGGSNQQNEQQQMQELEAAIALSKLEHDEQEKKRQLSEEEELQKVLQLSKDQQSQEQVQVFQQIQSNVKQPQQEDKKPLSKLEELKQKKAELERQKEEQKRQEEQENLDLDEDLGDGGELLNLSDNDDGATLLEQSQALGQQEFDDMIFSNRQALLNNLNNIESQPQEQQQQQQQQQPQQQQPQQQEETLEQKKERLKKQRELLLAKKKKERDDEAKEYTGEAQSPEKKNNVDQKELDHRKQLYQKINTNLEQN